MGSAEDRLAAEAAWTPAARTSPGRHTRVDALALYLYQVWRWIRATSSGTIQRLIDGTWTQVQLSGGDVPAAVPMPPDALPPPSLNDATTLPQDLAAAPPQESS